jgi:hypothetical protein
MDISVHSWALHTLCFQAAVTIDLSIQLVSWPSQDFYSAWPVAICLCLLTIFKLVDVGVGHLSNTLINKFRTEQPELEITEDEVRCVTLAGLCHDLGEYCSCCVMFTQIRKSYYP